jgi:hypothetical protein
MDKRTVNVRLVGSITRAFLENRVTFLALFALFQSDQLVWVPALNPYKQKRGVL